MFNSVSLEADRKFRNFKNSSFAIRKISDRLFLENGLSIIENPKLSKGNYGKWLGDEKASSNRKKLEQLIDSVLCECKDFDAFIKAVISTGCEVKRSKHLAIKIPGAKKNIRLDSLGENYTKSAIMERLSGTRIVASKEKINTSTSTGNEPQLLIDIQSKIRDGKGGGYVQWSKLFNLKQAAKTLMFLQEQGIDSYEELCEKSSAVSVEFSRKNQRIKEIESRLKDISELQKQIGTYGKTRDNYKKYISSGKDENLYDAYAADIILHKVAKKYFDGLGLKQLPKMTDLKQEYATLAAEKKKLYSGYHELKDKRNSLLTAKSNADTLLGSNKNEQDHDNTHRIKRSNSYEK